MHLPCTYNRWRFEAFFVKQHFKTLWGKAKFHITINFSFSKRILNSASNDTSRDQVLFLYHIQANLHADDFRNIWTKTQKISLNESTFTEKSKKSIVEKGKIARFEQFLLLSQCFQKSSAAEASESVYMRESVNRLSFYVVKAPDAKIQNIRNG